MDGRSDAHDETVSVVRDDQLRILHVMTRFLAAGAERNLLSHMRWEQDLGHDVALAMGRDSSPPADEGFAAHHVPHLVRTPHPLADIRAYRQLRRLVTEGNFDIVHTHQSKAGVLGRLASRGQAAVVHTVHMSSFGSGYGSLASHAFMRAERFCARFSDVIVCVGEELRDQYLAAGVGRGEQYHVVRSPIEIDAFASVRSLSEAQRAALREREGIDGAPLIVAVGALEPRKRHRLIVQALTPLLARGGATLAIAGAGPEEAALERQIAAAGIGERVRLLGHLDDVPALLGSADLFVHASTSEGVPQVVIQALAAGLPVVATDVVGLRELPDAPITIVDPDGRGLLEAVERVLAQPPQPLDLQLLEPWRPHSVHAQRAELLHRVETAVVRSRRKARR